MTVRNFSKNNYDLEQVVTLNYTKSESSNVWRRKDNILFSYTDGDEAENRIASCIAKVNDRTVMSKELANNQTDWTSEYHLSADRSNLLRPFSDIISKSTVLELGCGCGAITRFLGETAKSVVAVEGSLRRAEITANRTDGLENVTVICDLLQSLPFEKFFDVVTLIGVLEYSRKYIEAEDPIQYALESARSYLKPNGILLVAIENQLGLKYFAGAKEDHGLGVMSGINDLYTSETPVTFGKKELERRLRLAGFAEIEIHLPFPDYKLPCLIVHPTGYRNSHKWGLGTLLASTVFYDRQGISFPTFSLEAAWPVICRNNLVDDVSNSHLFICFNGEAFDTTDQSRLVSYYSPKRSNDTQQYIYFNFDCNRKVNVFRGKKDVRTGKFVETLEEYIESVTHASKLINLLQKPGWTYKEIEEWFFTWVNALVKYQINSDKTYKPLRFHDIYLPSNFIDAIPRNLMFDKSGEPIFIDLEWSLSSYCSLPLVIYRGLVAEFCTITSVAIPEKTDFIDPNLLLERLLKSLGIQLSESEKSHFDKIIWDLSDKAYGRGSPDSFNRKIILKNFNVRLESKNILSNSNLIEKENYHLKFKNLVALSNIRRIIGAIQSFEGIFAIYGAGEIGNTIYTFLNLSGFKPILFFDKNFSKLSPIDGVKVVDPLLIQELDVRLVIVASLGSFEDIENYVTSLNDSVVLVPCVKT